MDPIPTPAPAKKMEGKHVVIVGTGAAAVAAATTLRREGFCGKITMAGREAGAPETDLIDVERRDDGGIEIDDHLRVAPDVWLAGDIAAFSEVRSGTMARIEHWRLAEQHGAYIAKAILGAATPFRAAPFFWSNQGDKRLDYAGYAPDWDRIVVHGDIAALDFIAYYVKDDKALAACAIGHDPDMIAFLHRLDEGAAMSAVMLKIDHREMV